MQIMKVLYLHHANRPFKFGSLLTMLLMVIQAFFAFRVIARMIGTRSGQRIESRSDCTSEKSSVAVLVPVLNEEDRLLPCLDGLVQQGTSVTKIIVIDGGSTDSTQALVARAADRDDRIQLLVAPTPPSELNGKAWQLAHGEAEIDKAVEWVLTIDADVRPSPGLVDALLTHAASCGVQALSIATRQRLRGSAQGLVHPSMLATLVYRFGIPGHATDRVDH